MSSGLAAVLAAGIEGGVEIPLNQTISVEHAEYNDETGWKITPKQQDEAPDGAEKKKKKVKLYTAEEMKEQFDKGFEAGREESDIEYSAQYNEAVKKAMAEAAKNERMRIAGIRAAALPGQDKLAQELIDDGETTPEKAALIFNQAYRAELDARMKAIESIEIVTSAAVPASSDAGSAAMESGPEEWAKEFQRDPKLRSEFRNEKFYVAYRKAEADRKSNKETRK